jgi:hypothetical protein
MKHTLHAALLAVTIIGYCAAQAHTGGGAAGTTLNMARLQTVSGTVSAVNLGSGMEYPAVTIGGVAVKVAPVWYLLDKGFEIKAGDPLRLMAAPANSAADPYLYAVEIVNTATGSQIAVRDAAGVPLWTNRQAQGGPTANGSCLSGATVGVASGAIEQINSGLGIQMPTLTVKTAEGTLLTFKLGPERVLLQSDLELKAGDRITVKYAVASCTGELIALAVTDASGTTVVLRDDLGRPGWR